MNNIPANTYRYPVAIWELFNRTPHAGTFSSSTPGLIQVEVRTPANAAMLELSIVWQNHRAAAVRFRAYGCPTTVAVGGWLALWCRGRGAEELSQIRAADISRVLEMGEDRAHCAIMAEDVVHTFLARLRSEVTA